MIYSTHDITNLSSSLFRRDQVWFVEKDSYSASHLTSLVEYRFDDEERKNSFEFYRNYLNGKYGAIPFSRCRWIGGSTMENRRRGTQEKI